MIYLRQIAPKLTTDKTIINSVSRLNSDKNIMELFATNGIPKQTVIAMFEKHFGYKYVDVVNYHTSNKVLEKFDLKGLEKQKVFPYEMDEERKICYFVVSDITNTHLIDGIAEACKHMGYKENINFSFDYEILEKYEILKNKANPIQRNIPEAKIIGDKFDVQTWLNEVIDKGIRIGASDIHIEQLEDYFQIRYRIDGLLTQKQKFFFDETTISSIGVRLKIIGAMDISEKRKPQDGRIDNYKIDGEYYDIRVSSVATIFGEKFVMRLIPKSLDIKTFEELGFSNENRDKIIEMLKNKNGIIYLAGATGSGKSTSLYTMIENINKDDVNIYTIENPVEKTVKNVNQIQINPLAGLDYSSILKSLLRQDPDVIVVGEIRDVETAGLSVRASLTGHLVMATIHANNAIDSIGRLIDMGVEPYLLSASTIGFMSQRLVRKLCPHCKTKVEPVGYQKIWLEKTAEFYGVNLAGAEFYEANGCDKCTNGYKGRLSVSEVLEMDDELKSMVSKEAPIGEIRDKALRNGFKPIEIDGLRKAIEGITTIDELIRQLA